MVDVRKNNRGGEIIGKIFYVIFGLIFWKIIYFDYFCK